MRLSDRSIRECLKDGSIIIVPDVYSIQPNGVDVRLGEKFIVTDDFGRTREHIGKLLLRPNKFILGETLEHVTISPKLSGTITGTSSRGRDGLLIHVSAGDIDPGWSGRLTLEIKNLNEHKSIWLYPGMRIGKILFDWMDQEPEFPYGHPSLGSHYQGQTQVSCSLEEDWKE